ncbi:uncharacterized protein ARMOST_10752 [Armillaria ostoyae]|uniref:Uncharacterized protein n=1 Tax=Armillaria ostoyae TaxID=47428 RepID=A0A284RF80_ARMOS|nr:uncharacterized protein ARMOST_10752 [Armillaria ostoyae]
MLAEGAPIVEYTLKHNQISNFTCIKVHVDLVVAYIVMSLNRFGRCLTHDTSPLLSKYRYSQYLNTTLRLNARRLIEIGIPAEIKISLPSKRWPTM